MGIKLDDTAELILIESGIYYIKPLSGYKFVFEGVEDEGEKREYWGVSRKVENVRATYGAYNIQKISSDVAPFAKVVLVKEIDDDIQVEIIRDDITYDTATSCVDSLVYEKERMARDHKLSIEVGMVRVGYESRDELIAYN